MQLYAVIGMFIMALVSLRQHYVLMCIVLTSIYNLVTLNARTDKIVVGGKNEATNAN